MSTPSRTRRRVDAGPDGQASRRILARDRAWLWALALGAVGVGWRVVMLLLDVPPTNSDEATAGLAAMHIEQGREVPVFFYGQRYLGTLQSYLTAPLFALFGPSTLLLRVPPLVAYGLFLFLMYRLTARMLGPWFAVATVGVLALGSDRVVKNQLIGAGGYPEVSPMLAALFLIALGVASNAFKRPNLALAGWGLICGIALWTHWLAAPYVLGAAVVLVAGGWRRLLGAGGLATVVGLAAGAAPLLWYNLTAPRELNSISVLLDLNSAGGDPSLPARVLGGALVGIPMATGLCAPGGCGPARLWWAPVYLVLLGLAAVWSARACRTTDAPDRARSLTMLMLAASALVTIALYVRNPAAGETPLESARYLHFALVSTPVWIWALWRLGVGIRRRRFVHVLPAAVAGVVGLTMVVATVELGVKAPAYARWADENRDLVAALRAQGVSHAYGGYWTCHRLVFASAEDITCASLRDNLRRGVNRYPAYWEEVRRSSAPVFITRVEPGPNDPEPQLDAAVRRLLEDSRVPVNVMRVGGYVIYQASAPVALP